MSADFWAGYISGAIGILVGNPLDLVKTRLQAGPKPSQSPLPSPGTTAPLPGSIKSFDRWTSLARGAAAPILGYGALNALLFVTYNRSLAALNSTEETPPGALSIWTAGALGGLAIFFVSAPTELIKCRAQVRTPAASSLQTARELWNAGGIRGLYMGGGITSARDSVGYGFYFWSYELSKAALHSESDTPRQEALKVLFCGGLAGVVTWASIFPLDVIKTRVQTWDLVSHQQSNASPHTQPLLRPEHSPGKQTNPVTDRPSTFRIARQAYAAEGAAVFFRGLGICSARAFFVNAVQWAVYEYLMKVLTI